MLNVENLINRLLTSDESLKVVYEKLLKISSKDAISLSKQFISEEVSDILFNNLKIGINTPIPLGPGVMGHLKSSTETTINYSTIFAAFTMIGWHRHTDCEETITVKKGKLYIAYKNGDVDTLLPGKKYIIPAGEIHKAFTDLPTSINVFFKRV